MLYIMQRWIWNCSGILINPNPQSFSKHCKNGYLFATILYKYNVITLAQLHSAIQTDDPQIIRNNFHYLKIWLKLIDISLENIEEHSEWAKIWQLLCTLYLQLHDKNIYNVIAQRLTLSQNVFQLHSRFAVKNFQIEQKPEEHVRAGFTPQSNIISWNKQKSQYLHETLKQRLISNRNKLQKSDQENNQPLQQGPNRVSTILIPTTEKIFNYHKANFSAFNDISISKKTDPMKHIKNHYKSVRVDKEIKSHFTDELICNLFDNMNIKFENEMNDHILEFLHKQSMYEKQLMETLDRTNAYKYTILENSKALAEKIGKMQERLKSSYDSLQTEENIRLLDIYQLELQRNKEMHKRLYNETQRIEKTRNLTFCQDTLNDILDIVYRYVDYKECHMQEPCPTTFKEWLYLFVKSRPIFDLFEEMSLIVEYDEFFLIDDYDRFTEKQYKFEISRQNDIDQSMFDHYIERQKNCNDAMDNGYKICSHIITKLLLVKYPKPKTNNSVESPPIDKIICLSGVSDCKIIPVMEYFLKESGIKIIQMEDAINYCIRIYMEEVPHEKIEEVLNITTEKTFLYLEEQKYGSFATVFTPIRKCAKYNPYVVSAKDEHTNAYTQSDLQHPIQWSEPGRLGKFAYEILHLGDEIPHEYVVHMFIEYLKSIKNTHGLLLINFPHTNSQLKLLEEILNNNSFPTHLLHSEKLSSKEDLTDFNLREMYIKWPIQSNIPHVTSQLYEIAKEIEFDYYESCIKMFVKMENQTDDYSRTARAVEKFYNSNVLSYIFTYNRLDITTIKELCNLIMQKEKYWDTKNNEIILYQVGVKTEKLRERFPYTLEETQAGNEMRKKLLKKAKKKKKNEKTETIYVDKVVQIPELDEDYQHYPSKIGDSNWKYLTIPMPNNHEVFLASYWEVIEEAYCVSYKELCFMYRININMHVPYISFFKKYIKSFFITPDDSQLLLEEFQVKYNDIDDEIRDDPGVRAELHYRLNELNLKLKEIAMERRNSVEVERRNFNKDNWFAIQICELLNIYITFLQIELDRYVNTIQFLTDYYTSMITKVLRNETFNEIELAKIKVDAEVDGIIQYVQRCLHLDIEFTDINPLCTILFDNYNKTVAGVEKLQKHANDIQSKFKRIFKSSEPSTAKSNREKAFAKTEPMEFDKEICDKSREILEEWKYAIDGEYSRVLYCLNLLHGNHLTELKDLVKQQIETNRNLYEIMQNYFCKYIENIDKVCEIIAYSIEHCYNLREKMVLRKNKFYIKPDVIMCKNSLVIEKSILEPQNEYIFTVKQLDFLVNIFMEVAPDGHIHNKKLEFILQDLITKNTHTGEMLVPNVWFTIELERMISHIFGDVQYVSWKDFIIHNLNIRLLTEREVLIMRRIFRSYDQNSSEIVTLKQFYDIKLWFECDTTDYDDVVANFRIQEIKKLLAKLYATTYEAVNYTVLLLDFCKDEDTAAIGFVKALELYTGSYVCYDITKGEVYKSNLLINTSGYESPSEDESKLSCLCSLDNDEATTNSEDRFNTIYLLPLNTFINVLSVTLPCYIKATNIERESIIELLNNAYNEFKYPKFNNQVFIYEFLNSTPFKLLLTKTRKFLYHSPKSFYN